jgi:hypothetical protein
MKRLTVKKTTVDSVARERITGHEKLCAERHEQINIKMDTVITRLDKISKAVFSFGGGLALLIIMLNLGLVDFRALLKNSYGTAQAQQATK